MNKVIQNLILLLLAATAFSFRSYAQSAHENLEIVARLEVRPGDVAVSKKGRVFSTIHSLGSRDIQLIEILGTDSYKPYPDNSFQKNGKAATDKVLNSPLGLIFDENDNLWVIDMGQKLGKTRLGSFDIKN